MAGLAVLFAALASWLGWPPCCAGLVARLASFCAGLVAGLGSFCAGLVAGLAVFVAGLVSWLGWPLCWAGLVALGCFYCACMLMVAGLVVVPVALLASMLRLIRLAGADGRVPVIWQE